MTEEQIYERLVPMIVEVTGVRPEEISMASVLVTDLGAESLDLLDLSFLIAEEFGVTLEADEFERQAKQRMPDGTYEEGGLLTEAAVVELRQALPEIDHTRLVAGLRKVDLPMLLTVSVFVRLIQRKLAEETTDA